MPRFTIEDKRSLVDVLTATGIAKSKREGREWIANGSIQVNGEKGHRPPDADQPHGSLQPGVYDPAQGQEKLFRLRFPIIPRVAPESHLKNKQKGLFSGADGRTGTLLFFHRMGYKRRCIHESGRVCE